MGKFKTEIFSFEPPAISIQELSKRKVEIIDFFNEYCNEINSYKFKFPIDDIILCHQSQPIPIDYDVYFKAHNLL